MRADRPLWWNADKTRLVEDGDVEAAFLAYPAGTKVSAADEAKVPGVSAPEADADAETKSRRPQANKARARGEDK